MAQSSALAQPDDATKQQAREAVARDRQRPAAIESRELLNRGVRWIDDSEMQDVAAYWLERSRIAKAPNADFYLGELHLSAGGTEKAFAFYFSDYQSPSRHGDVLDRLLELCLVRTPPPARHQEFIRYFFTGGAEEIAERHFLAYRILRKEADQRHKDKDPSAPAWSAAAQRQLVAAAELGYEDARAQIEADRADLTRAARPAGSGEPAVAATTPAPEPGDGAADSYDIRLLWAGVRDAAGDHEGAESELRRLIAMQPKRPEALSVLAWHELVRGRVASVRELLAALIAQPRPAGEAEQSTSEYVTRLQGALGDVEEEKDALLRAGESLLERGLTAKAADRFATAYIKDWSDGAVGLKVASLHLALDGGLITALKYWRLVMAHAPAPYARQAEEQIQRHKAELDALATKMLAEARGPKQRAPVFVAQLAYLFPEHREIRILFAQILAEGGAVELAIREMGRASRLGLRLSEVVASEEFVALYNKGGLEYQQFLRDAYGADAPGRVAARRAEVRAARAARIQASNFVLHGLGLMLVALNGGEFMMGDSAGPEGAQPAFRVRLNPYWIGSTEVTNRMWAIVMGDPAEPLPPDLPVVNVSWEDAQEFCRRLTQRESLMLRVGAGFEYALPTEAQWEFAARGGRTALDGTAAEMLQEAWVADNSGKRLHAVARRAPNPHGLFDMRGNAAEWCRDVMFGGYDHYSRLAVDGVVHEPEFKGQGDMRILRGGSFRSAGQESSTYVIRHAARTTQKAPYIGFRIVYRKRPQTAW